MKLCVECGQRWWQWSSWVDFKYPNVTGYRGPRFRRLILNNRRVGWAFGPMMLFLKRRV